MNLKACLLLLLLGLTWAEEEAGGEPSRLPRKDDCPRGRPPGGTRHRGGRAHLRPDGGPHEYLHVQSRYDVLASTS